MVGEHLAQPGLELHPLDGERDADLLEFGGEHVGDRGGVDVRHGQREREAVRKTGAGKEFLGVGRIVGVDRGEIFVPGVLGRHVAADRDAAAVGLDHVRVVDALPDRVPHGRIGERRVRVVERQRELVRCGPVEHGERAVVRERLQQRRIGCCLHVGLAGPLRVVRGVRVGDVVEDDRGDLGLRAPVAVEPVDGDGRTAVPGADRERAAAVVLRVQRGEVRALLVDDAFALGQVPQQPGVAVLEGDHHGARVGRGDRVDRGEVRRVDAQRSRRGLLIQRPPDIRRGQRLAVMEVRVGHQVEGVGQAVGRLVVGRGQLRHDRVLPGHVHGQQVLVDVGQQQLVERGARGGERVQAGRFQRQPHVDGGIEVELRVRRRRGQAGRAGGRPARRAGAAGDEGGGGQQRDQSHQCTAHAGNPPGSAEDNASLHATLHPVILAQMAGAVDARVNHLTSARLLDRDGPRTAARHRCRHHRREGRRVHRGRGAPGRAHRRLPGAPPAPGLGRTGSAGLVARLPARHPRGAGRVARTPDPRDRAGQPGEHAPAGRRGPAPAEPGDHLAGHPLRRGRQRPGRPLRRRGQDRDLGCADHAGRLVRRRSRRVLRADRSGAVGGGALVVEPQGLHRRQTHRPGRDRPALRGADRGRGRLPARGDQAGRGPRRHTAGDPARRGRARPVRGARAGRCGRRGRDHGRLRRRVRFAHHRSRSWSDLVRNIAGRGRSVRSGGADAGHRHLPAAQRGVRARGADAGSGRRGALVGARRWPHPRRGVRVRRDRRARRGVHALPLRRTRAVVGSGGARQFSGSLRRHHPGRPGPRRADRGRHVGPARAGGGRDRVRRRAGPDRVRRRWRAQRPVGATARGRAEPPDRATARRGQRGAGRRAARRGRCRYPPGHRHRRQAGGRHRTRLHPRAGSGGVAPALRGVPRLLHRTARDPREAGSPGKDERSRATS